MFVSHRDDAKRLEYEHDDQEEQVHRQDAQNPAQVKRTQTDRLPLLSLSYQEQGNDEAADDEERRYTELGEKRAEMGLGLNHVADHDHGNGQGAQAVE